MNETSENTEPPELTPEEKDEYICPEDSLTATAEEWSEFLADEGFNFENQEQVGQLMAYLSRGVRETCQKFSEKGIDFPPPDVGIHLLDTAAGIGYYEEMNMVLIGKWLLEDILEMKAGIDQQMQITKGDRTLYEGKLSEWVLSMGDEEAHHSLFVKVKGKRQETISPDSMTIAEYQARPIERRAQRYVIQSAIKRNFSAQAIAFLEKQYQASGDLLDRK
jgi:hypothetical protein